jgi:chromosome partitioning protein
MRVISFWTGKGGSGKTTCAVQLAAALAERGARVLVVDLDPLAGATELLGELPEPGIMDVLRGDLSLAEIAMDTTTPGVALVPAGPELTRIERLLAGEPDRQERVAIALEEVPADAWDVVVLDAAPGLGLLGVSTLVAAREHVAVIDPRPLSAACLAETLGMADAVRGRLNADLGRSRVLLSRVPATPASAETEAGVRRSFGERVLRTMIPECVSVVDASTWHEPVVSFAPDSPAGRAFGDLSRELAPSEAPSASVADRARLQQWLIAHPGAVHGDDNAALASCERAVRRQASEDAWRQARVLLEDRRLAWQASYPAREPAPLAAARLCHTLADRLRELEPLVDDGCEERITGGVPLAPFGSEAREPVGRWVRGLAHEYEHREWLKVVSFTDARGRRLLQEVPGPDSCSGGDPALLVTRVLARDYEEHARRAAQSAA